MFWALNGGEDPENPLGQSPVVAGGWPAAEQAWVTAAAAAAAAAAIDDPTEDNPTDISPEIELNEGDIRALLDYFHALTEHGIYIPAVIAYCNALPKDQILILMANNPAIAKLRWATVINRENSDS